METKENTFRMSQCPSFEKCNAQKCPLDDFINERIGYSNENKCVATKRIRILLGVGLKYHGLTAQEYTGVKQWHGDIDAYFKRFQAISPSGEKTKGEREGYVSFKKRWSIDD